MDKIHKSDEEILALLNTNKDLGINYLYKKYYKQVYTWTFTRVKDNMVTEDICQEIFTSIYKRKKELIISSSLGAYLKTSAYNRALSYIKRGKQRYAEIDDEIIQIPSSESSGTDILELEQLQKAIWTIVDTLPPRCKEIFFLSRREGLRNKEIAQKLGIKPKTVENQIHDAVKKIKAILIPQLEKGIYVILLTIASNILSLQVGDFLLLFVLT